MGRRRGCDAEFTSARPPIKLLPFLKMPLLGNIKPRELARSALEAIQPHTESAMSPDTNTDQCVACELPASALTAWVQRARPRLHRDSRPCAVSTTSCGCPRRAHACATQHWQPAHCSAHQHGRLRCAPPVVSRQLNEPRAQSRAIAFPTSTLPASSPAS